MNKDIAITIKKNSNLCFSYTDRKNSYFHIHCKNKKFTDGLWCEKTQLINNFGFFDSFSNKVIDFSDFEKIIYKPFETEAYYKSLKLSFSLLFSVFSTAEAKATSKKNGDFPIIRISFSDRENRYFPCFEIPPNININFYDKQNSLKIRVVKKKLNKLVILESEEKAEIFCAFEENLKYENLLQQYKNHIFEVEKFFEKVDLQGCGQLSESTLWAMFSGWLLVTGEIHRGIWAGLPWFRDNWGRDTFIALSGILLVSGQFQEAKSVISSFAEYQDKNPESKTYGRIPNRYIDEKNVIYNTADGTLWFIREVWEYLQYTGDFDFLQKMWPVIKLALESDIENRMDDFGFLCHGDADTWMDARIQGKQALSPRGSRANDIQILWYTALKIAEKMALYQQDKAFFNKISEISEKLKQKFLIYFFNDDESLISDCIKSKNQQDLSIRPNGFFAFSVPQLLEKTDKKLFLPSDEINIIKKLVSNLVFEYGVLSLSQNHENFHPYHDKCRKYHKDAAYHNGTIWVWNSGPVVDSLCKIHQQNLAYKLSCFHSKQLLDSGDNKTFGSRCIGSLSENINPYKIRKKIYPSGTWSQAWSVSEFARNLFQSYLGIRPNLMEQKLIFEPALPFSWNDGKIKCPIGDGFFTVKWNKNWDLSKKSVKKNVMFYDFSIFCDFSSIKELEVSGIFDKEYETKMFPLENGKLNVSFGIINEKEDFSFALEEGFFAKLRKKSVIKKDYLFKKILSESKSEFFTDVQ